MGARTGRGNPRPGRRLNLYRRRCLPTIVARSAKLLNSIWPGINPVAQTTTPGARNPPRAVAISTRPSRNGRNASNPCSVGAVGARPCLLLIIVCLILAGWILTGFYQVKSAERGVVQRFGKHVDTVGDGLGWRLPWPIETVTKVNVAGASDHRPVPSRVLTAEANMVELQLSMQYQIKDPAEYLFKVQDPEGTLGEVGESAIREVVGRNDQRAILEPEPRAYRDRHARDHAAHARSVRRRAWKSST